MKTKIIFIIISILFTTVSKSQSLTQSIEPVRSEVIKSNEKTKSGNYKDILSSFFQLATTNFSGEEKTIDFNSTLFAIKTKANPELEKDINYIKETFSRNLQFNFKANLNKDFKYTGFTGGVTYAIINDRDKSVVEFGENFDKIYGEFINTVHNAAAPIVTKISDGYNDRELTLEEKNALSKKVEEVNNIVNQYINNENFTSDSPFIEEFKSNLKSQNIDSKKELLVEEIHKYSAEFYKEIESKALWTLTTDGTANKEGKFNKASFGTVFLKGNKQAWNEIDIRAKFTYADTLATEHLPRTGLDVKAGINFKIGKTNKQQSYFEIKALGEYNKIFHNVLPEEDSQVITANAEIRIRVANDLWIPLVIKYDIENSNFLGFLNVTYNFEGFN
ncbi:MAG: hypothetical protein V4572_05300 [Bacteroidota bacterium]